MKVKISYRDGEDAQAVISAIQHVLPGRVRHSDRHPPYRHIYIEIPEKCRENLDFIAKK